MDIIIGAGVTGVSYAAFTANDYLIFEQDSEYGGYCKTIKDSGFVWDYSGHFFHFQNKWVQDLVCRNMNAADIVQCTKHTQIKYGSAYIDFPFQMNIHQLPQQEFIDCLYDLFAAKADDYSTFSEMLYARFGTSIAQKFLIPYNEKLYACALDTLDAGAMGRFFPYANREEIVLNFRRPRTDSYNSRFAYPKGGAIEYIRSLCANVAPSKIMLGEKVVGIAPAAKTLQTTRRTLCYDNLISTMPFDALLRMTDTPFNQQTYTANKVLVFNLGFDGKGADSVNHWVYFPDRETCFYRVGFYDNILGGSRMSLYVEMGFERDAHIDVGECRQRILSDLRREGILTTQNLIAEHHVVMDPAYVHITAAGIEDVQLKKAFLERSNIYSIGRYGSWTYCSIEDNILEAHALSQKIGRGA